MSLPHPPCSKAPPRAFTLVEVLIVVVILGILAAIVVPQFADASHETSESALRSTIASLRTLIDMQYHAATPPGYPATIDAAWFATGGGLTHPENTFSIPSVEIDSTAGRSHPPNKMLTAAMPGAFWYNPTNGLFRARIANRGSNAATLAAYNRVNDSSETALGNGGGGGGGS